MKNVRSASKFDKLFVLCSCTEYYLTITRKPKILINKGNKERWYKTERIEDYEDF